MMPRREDQAKPGQIQDHGTAGDNATTFAGCRDVEARGSAADKEPTMWRGRMASCTWWSMVGGGRKKLSLSGTFLLVRTPAIRRRPRTWLLAAVIVGVKLYKAGYISAKGSHYSGVDRLIPRGGINILPSLLGEGV